MDYELVARSWWLVGQGQAIARTAKEGAKHSKNGNALPLRDGGRVDE